MNINISSSALGDTLAWVPYVEEYRRKKNVKVNLKCDYNELFIKSYPDILFVDEMNNVDFDIGWFQKDRSRSDSRLQPLQKTASDTLGLDYREIKPKVDVPSGPRPFYQKYVCINTHSTAQAKYWNNKSGWNEVISFLKSKDYIVIAIDKHKQFGNQSTGYVNNTPRGVLDATGKIPLSERMHLINHADFFIGLGSGLSWLSWAVGTHVFLISGFSKPFCEFSTNVSRIHNNSVCSGCFNTPDHVFDRGNWAWCPEKTGTNRMFECTKSITGDFVINKIQNFLRNRHV